MLGRVLFVLVCLIIATGLLLPIYPAEVAMPGMRDARDMLIADAAARSCRDCGAAAAKGSVSCGHAQPAAVALGAAVAPGKACVHLTVYVIVRPVPVTGHPGEPQLLRPRLPTI